MSTGPTLIERSWHVVATSRQVEPGPVAVELQGQRLVAVRLGSEVAVLPAACPHRGTDLSLGGIASLGDDPPALQCPYHGWTFDSRGTCTSIPSLPDGPIPQAASSRAYAVIEQDGLVWANADPRADLSHIPSLPVEAPGMRTLVGEPMVWNTSAGRHVENILDLAHFPFVHPGTFGCSEAEVVASHQVERGGDWIAADVPVVTRNPHGAEGPMYPGLGPLVSLGYRYEVTAPYRITLTFAATVFAEDRPVIESQPPGLPLEPGAEVHVPADRLAVAYRRLLRDLGCTTADRL